MLRIGLTGGIGSGKTSVSRLLAQRGATVVDADGLAREVVAPGSPGLAAVRAAFGDGVVTPGGELDRAALAARVFGDEAERARLNAILHPLIGEATVAAFAAAAAAGAAVLVHDVALLVEAGLAGDYDLVVVVTAPEQTRLARLRDRGLAESDARARMAVQASDEQRAAVADVVIDNSGTPADLGPQVEELWARLLRHPSYPRPTLDP